MIANHLSPDFSLKLQSLSLKASLIPWDTTLLGFPVGQINHIEIRNDIIHPETISDFITWRDGHGLKMLACRTEHNAIRETMFLEDQGFRFVEMVFPVAMDDIRSANFSAEIFLASASESDIDAIQHIAQHAFSTGRFQIDPRLGAKLGGDRYAGWILNSFNDPKYKIIKASVDEKIIGFFMTENIGQGTIYWHLTAIAPEWQGQGFGQSVWQSMTMRHKREGFTGIRTTVSAHNPAILNLYGKLRFRFGAPMMTFHWVTK